MDPPAAPLGLPKENRDLVLVELAQLPGAGDPVPRAVSQGCSCLPAPPVGSPAATAGHGVLTPRDSAQPVWGIYWHFLWRDGVLGWSNNKSMV